MPTRLIRSIPFWILLLGSIVTAAVGLWITMERLSVMETSLLAGTATGVEVYVGQSWAVVGAVLIGAGVLGILLSLMLGVLSKLLSAPTVVEVVEEPVAEEPVVVDDEPDFDDSDDLDEPEFADTAHDDETSPVTTDGETATETTESETTETAEEEPARSAS